MGWFEQHASYLGRLVGNLLSIEMGARMTIVKLDAWAAKHVNSQLPQIQAGQLVELNAFTKPDDLRQTLEKFNKHASPACRVEVDALVELRDSLAHGRMFGYGDMNVNPLRLLKFARTATDGKVLVEQAHDMTESWFQSNIQMLQAALEKIRVTLDYEQRNLD
jgi:hypothetical protein